VTFSTDALAGAQPTVSRNRKHYYYWAASQYYICRCGLLLPTE